MLKNPPFLRGRNSFYTFLVVAVLTSIIAVSAGFEFFASRRFEEVEQKIEDYIAEDTDRSDSELDAEKLTNIQKTLVDIKSSYSELRGARLILDAMGVFVVVGGGVGGYLLSQAQSNEQRRRELERQEIDTMVSDIIKELSSPEEQKVLRASAAVKLGQILDEFPAEWEFFGSESQKNKRQEQILDLIKSVLAAALSIEDQEYVRKRIADNLNKHALSSYGDLDGLFRILEESSVASQYPAMQTLRARKHQSLAEKNKGLFDMQNLDLSNAKADGSYWPQCLFKNTDFHRAQFNNSCLKDSYFKGIRFRHTHFQGALISRSCFERCKFTLVELKQADLSGSVFLESTSFERAAGEATILARCFLEKVKFKDSQFSKAKFLGADLSGAEFQDCDLSEAVFSSYKPESAAAEKKCCLKNAIFKKVNLHGVNFSGADLTGAHFQECELSKANFRGVTLDGATFEENAGYDEACFDA